jgi:hypothetical protein
LLKHVSVEFLVRTAGTDVAAAGGGGTVLLLPKQRGGDAPSIDPRLSSVRRVSSSGSFSGSVHTALMREQAD